MGQPRVAHVVARMGPLDTGPARSVPLLCRELAGLGVDVELHTVEPARELQGESFAYRIHRSLRWPRKLGVSISLLRTLAAAVRDARIVHFNGLWRMPDMYPGLAARKRRSMFVVSPHGSLSPTALQVSRNRKRMAWMLFQKKALQNAVCIHATAEAELRDARRAGLRPPVAIIPNGVDIPAQADGPVGTTSRRKRLLYLGRLHHIKGVDLLVRAWSRVLHAAEDWELRIVGPDDGAAKELKILSKELGCRRISFHGPVFGEQKDEEYRNAHVYVLPSRSECFGLTVAEALASARPVLTTKGTPWSGLRTRGCGWWVDVSAAALADCLEEIVRLPRKELEAMGVRGRAWVKEEFSWKRVASMMRDTYEWILGGGTPPGWVVS